MRKKGHGVHMAIAEVDRGTGKRGAKRERRVSEREEHDNLAPMGIGIGHRG